MQLHDACSCVVKIYTTTTCKQALAGSTTSLYLSPCEKFNLVQCKLCVINGATAHLGTVHTVRGVGAKLAATATAVSSIVITLLRDLRRLSSAVSLLLQTASPPVNEL